MEKKLEKAIQSQICTGTWNLLHNCADLQPGEKLLLVCEDSSLGWYDRKVAEIIEDAIGRHFAKDETPLPDQTVAERLGKSLDV